LQGQLPDLSRIRHRDSERKAAEEIARKIGNDFPNGPFFVYKAPLNLSPGYEYPVIDLGSSFRSPSTEK
jgi:hypothetical protein